MGWATPIKPKNDLDNDFYNVISKADHIHRYPAKMMPKLAYHFLYQVSLKKSKDER